MADEFDFFTYMANRAQLVQEASEKALAPDGPKEILDAMRYSMLGGGKKVRPALCLAACELVGGRSPEYTQCSTLLMPLGDINTAMPTACACEMIHVMSLVHDDLPCMDDDDFRRGRETTHVKYGEGVFCEAGCTSWGASCVLLGEDIAVLAGDALLCYAFEHVARDTTGIPPERVVKVADLWISC